MISNYVLFPYRLLFFPSSFRFFQALSVSAFVSQCLSVVLLLFISLFWVGGGGVAGLEESYSGKSFYYLFFDEFKCDCAIYQVCIWTGWVPPWLEQNREEEGIEELFQLRAVVKMTDRKLFFTE
jgi:hypothetical protein